MSYCINPVCNARTNPGDLDNCQACGTPLLINGRFRLLEPLRPLDPHGYTDVFEVVDEIGEGFGGQWVFEPGTRKVMKVLKSTNPELIKLMRREARMLQLLAFRGRIPRVFPDDYFGFIPNGSLSQLHCLVLEKFEGQNLEQWLKANGPISQSLALNWLQQIVLVLEHVHQASFFHRDIKPTNIILKPSGELALIDFGGIRKVTETYLAKISGSQNTTGISETLDVTAIMTVGYAPPEQFNAKALPQSDFFALGRTFVHLMTGVHPRKLPSDEQTGNLLWRDRARHIGEPFANFIDELMAIAPGKRPQNTQIILQRLERLPQQLKWRRVVKSKQFTSGVIGLVILAISGACRIGLPWAANQWFSQGVKAQLNNDSEAAQREFEVAIMLEPKLTYSISSFYFDQADLKQNSLSAAKRYYELALKYNPADVDAYNNLALVCQNLNDLNCIMTNYREVFKLSPHHWESHFGLGRFYEERGNYSAAQGQYNSSKKADGELSAQALDALSRLSNLKKDYPSAAKLASRGLPRTTDSELKASLYKNLGWAEWQLHQYEDAESDLSKAWQLDRTRTDTYCLLAQVKEAQRDTSHAISDWIACLSMNSELPEVHEWKREALIKKFLSNEH